MTRPVFPLFARRTTCPSSPALTGLLSFTKNMASTKCVVSQGVAAMRREIQANAKQGLLCGTCNQKTDRVFTYDRKLLDGLAYKPKFGTNVLTSHAIDPLPEKYYPRVKMASYTADDEIDWLKGGEAGRMLVKGTWKQPLIVVFKPAGSRKRPLQTFFFGSSRHFLRCKDDGRRRFYRIKNQAHSSC